MRLIPIDHPALRERTGKGVSIAVIDSGVNPEHPHVGDIAGGVALTTDGEMHDDYVDRLGHGTAVTAAIQEKAPDAEIHVVKVFDDALATSVPTLVRAIDWASERGFRLVNLSLGTPNAHRAAQLLPAIERAVDRCTIVVSALRNEGRSWFPGSLPGAVGVVLDPNCSRNAVGIVERTSALATPSLPLDPSSAVSTVLAIAASPYPRPIPRVPVEHNLNGISFAVANATGVLARLIEDAPAEMGPEAIVTRLAGLAVDGGDQS